MSRLNILVSGRLAGAAGQGGAAWAVLQYVLGFRHLGHNVRFIEALSPEEPWSSGTAYFRDVVRDYGLSDVAGLVSTAGESLAALPYECLLDYAASCDLLLNISGVLRDEALLEQIPVRGFLDIDPAFTQMWHDVQGIDMNFAGHTHFLTIGQALGTAGYRLPNAGLPWQTVCQPVVLEEWPVVQTIPEDSFTTVANWRAYGSIEYEGQLYGQKVHSLRQFIDLPVNSAERFAMALSIHPDEERDLAALKANGWELRDPLLCASTPQQYRDFVQSSRAEFGIAKTGYTVSRCGWFSDRSVCYLASGRPVIAQETGFSDYLPVGLGLHAFSTADDFNEAARELRGDYPRHARAARDIAEAYFDSAKVLSLLLAKVGLQ